MTRKLTCIVAMDAAGYCRQMELDEAGTLSRLKDMRARIIDPAVARRSGRIVKVMGDGALMDFASVVDAVECAIEIQNQLARAEDDPALKLRIGIHLGDVIVDVEDIYGDGVNVASRLEAIAAPGGIVISRQVYDLIEGKISARLEPLGEQNVKNISRPIDAFAVSLDEARDGETGDGETRDGETGGGGAGAVIRFGGFELDTALYELRSGGAPAPVEPQVFDLILFLARNADRTVTKDEIFSAIWGDRIVSDSALSSQIKAARRALGDDGARQKMIATVHGRGFRFVAEIESKASPIVAAAEAAPERAVFASRPSVAILPFVNMNRDPDEDYFADGISEDITTALSRNRWLTVIARNPAFSFRGAEERGRAIGEKLGADYIVTGSVRKAGTRARVTAQLIDAENEHSIWSERFDRDMVDIFDLQDEISEMVAARIESELGLSEQKKAERRPRKNRGAWDLYQLGCAQFYKFTPENNLRSQELLRQAIALDPTMAEAHSRLAYAIVLSMVYFDVPPDPALMDEALTAAQRAIELDDQDANGYFTIGRVYLARREYDLAIEALKHALELNPCLAVSYCGLGDSLAYEGRLDEAIQQFEVAIKLSPQDPFRWAFYSYRALAHLFRGEFDDAVGWARKSVSIPNAQYWARAHLISALGHLGDEEQASAALGELVKLKPEFSVAFAREHLFYLKREDQLEMYLDGLRKAGAA